MITRPYICLIAFLIGIPSLKAQEAQFFDDTTQEVYGLQSTLFITTADIKYNRAGFRPVIISIDRMHRFTYRQRYANRLQDLGNDGTALNAILYMLPTQVGATSGFHVYDSYFQNPEEIKYYDTKSPYTDGYMVLANFGSYVVDMCHSRSFNKNWHLGASFQTMLTDKEYIPTTIPGDRNVITYPFTLFAHYKTDNARYQVLGSFSRKNHRVRETGGIRSATNPSPIDWLRAKAEIKNNLDPKDSIESSELRHQYHLYHQVAFVDQLQAYHEVMLRNKFNLFQAAKLSFESKQYLGDTLLLKQDAIHNSTIMQTLGNELGIKGDVSRLFYRCYYHNRQIDLQRTNLSAINGLQEHYLGLQTRLNLRDSVDLLHIGGEYLLGGLYQVHTAYQGAFLDLSYDRVKYKPSFLAQHYHSPHRSWENDFKSPTTTQVCGGIHYRWPVLLLRPHASFTRVEKLIYFKQSKQSSVVNTVIAPDQAQEYADIITLGTDANLTLWSHFHADNELIFTDVRGPAAHVFRVPEFWINSRLYYARTLYEGRLDLETGMDMHWKSTYKAAAYDPATQQFYLQDKFLVYSYLVADLFFSFRIKSFRGFVKLTHLNQGLPLEGYFVTPYYPGQLRSLDVGVSWSFFD